MTDVREGGAAGEPGAAERGMGAGPRPHTLREGAPGVGDVGHDLGPELGNGESSEAGASALEDEEVPATSHLTQTNVNAGETDGARPGHVVGREAGGEPKSR